MTKNTGTAGSTPQAAIIIPLYNKQGTISQSLDSALGQENAQVEVLVVDDGSQDDSVRVVEEYGDAVSLIRQSNGGPSAARNTGTRAATADLLIFLDADDVLAPNAVELHLRARQEYPGMRLSIGSAIRVLPDGTEEFTMITDRTESSEKDAQFVPVRDFLQPLIIGITSSGFAVNRPIFESVGGFDERLRCWEISNILLKILVEAGSCVLIRDIVTTKFEQGADSQFAKESGNPYLSYLFHETVIELMRRGPKNHEATFLRSWDSAISGYFHNGEFAYCRILGRKSLMSFLRNGKLTRWVIIALLPDFVQRLLYRYTIGKSAEPAEIDNAAPDTKLALDSRVESTNTGRRHEDQRKV